MTRRVHPLGDGTLRRRGEVRGVVPRDDLAGAIPGDVVGGQDVEDVVAIGLVVAELVLVGHGLGPAVGDLGDARIQAERNEAARGPFVVGVGQRGRLGSGHGRVDGRGDRGGPGKRQDEQGRQEGRGGATQQESKGPES